MGGQVDTLRREHTSHRHCFACGAENEHGLGLVFAPNGERSVRGECVIDERFQGYPGVVQGGIVSTILDCAMTNCLFAQGIEAMTARLNIQFHRPVPTQETLVVRGVLVRNRGRVYELKASIACQGSACASATGRFITLRDPA